MTWTGKGYRPGPKCVDPRDNVPPHHDPPAKADFTEVWLELCRQQLTEAKARGHDEAVQRKRAS
jgi:hypothetical protein